MILSSITDEPGEARQGLVRRFKEARRRTRRLTEPLTAEDMNGQSMADASPTKWHLAHTTWFFATFLLADAPGPAWADLYNSYYESLGRPFPRPLRGLLTRPGIEEVLAWHDDVTAGTLDLMETVGDWGRVKPLVELGIAHEEQHQELILTDILHLFASNPLDPAYLSSPRPASGTALDLEWVACPGGIVSIGHDGAGFAFDNESPRHQVFLQPWRLASRLVTNGEFQAFIEDGGYRRPELWLSEGWAAVCQHGWAGPPYWRQDGGAGSEMTLFGLQPIDPAAPVAHVGFFEADAYARWVGKRLPTEAEWEWAASLCPVDGNDLGRAAFRPLPAESGGLRQMFGDLWEWTASPYLAYPGYRPAAGALGEYNGKFMINQMVLRGGSCVTPPGHMRATYRNFFPAAARWQFSGIRLAEDA
jgi:ergothioneine biosynthesis protein EgtB